ncbi:copper homeostasis protein CutC [Granulicella paludicola]|uniref:copper homeostasis protein CutC n=1 Tax=Granulicella paludicola TaxID=474951 RepID=UPI0021E0A6AB|nr:copper homeostasis protein CutC [Granulicella paludicola]
MRKIIFELCAETVDACLAAREGGADRIELCSGLSEGGLTPSHGLVREALQQSDLPVHVLIRPRGGNYLYTEAEIAVMAEDILHVKSLGAAGVVLGLLKADRTVDVETTRNFVQLARPMQVTFHRAFDDTPDLETALEAVISTGCERVLTSGGCTDVAQGAEILARLVKQADGRLEVAVGGGLRLTNASSLVRLTGATHFHGSLRPGREKRVESADGALVPETEYSEVEVTAVREMVEQLQLG